MASNNGRMPAKARTDFKYLASKFFLSASRAFVLTFLSISRARIRSISPPSIPEIRLQDVEGHRHPEAGQSLLPGSAEFCGMQSISVPSMSKMNPNQNACITTFLAARERAARRKVSHNCHKPCRQCRKNSMTNSKTALDETRLLLLVGQVLLGFQFQAFFQEGFTTLSGSAKYLSLGGLVLIVVSMALLVAPVMQHRLVEGGDASQRLLRITTRFAQ